MAQPVGRVTPTRTPEITVVIPTRNRLSLLREAIESVERQSFAHWEVVVVDDASDDGTAAWLGEIDDSRVRSLRLAVRSERTVARNRGLAEARSRLIVFLDDDDRLAPGALGVLNDALWRRPQAVAAVGAAVRFDLEGRRERASHPRRESMRTVWREVLAGWDSGAGQAAVRTDALRRAGGWNEKLVYWELGELWFRIARLGPIVFLPQTVLEIRLHPNQNPPGPLSMDPRAEFVQGLPEPDRREGKRILRARELVLAGDDARFGGDYRRALVHYLQGIATAPLLLRSPLTRTDLVGNVGHVAPRAVIGRRGRARLRRLRRLKRSRSA
jgi:glycosyltransferase involved in cell wall biosynthesis